MVESRQNVMILQGSHSARAHWMMWVFQQGFVICMSNFFLSVSQCYENAVITSWQTDLSGHATDGKTQFLPSVSSNWLSPLVLIEYLRCETQICRWCAKRMIFLKIIAQFLEWTEDGGKYPLDYWNWALCLWWVCGCRSTCVLETDN